MDCDWDFQLKNPGLASSELTNGLARTGQRALLYATGMDEEDMKKPFVAVINSFSEMVPGHMHMRELAEQVKYGILEGGGIPRETGTIAICDGLCQGHCGMRYPLPSWDLIADSIEMVVQAHHFDAMVLIPGCDKIIPGMLMAAARLDIPAIVVTGGPMLPGNVGGNPLFCSSELREFPGRVEQGSCTVEEMKKAEEAALPTVGSCAHLGTANSMCMLTQRCWACPCPAAAPLRRCPTAASASPSSPAGRSWSCCAGASPPGKSSRGRLCSTAWRGPWPPAPPPIWCSTCWPSLTRPAWS